MHAVTIPYCSDNNALPVDFSRAAELEIAVFRPESSDHRPRTIVRLMYSANGLHLHYSVADRYVRCIQTEFNGQVCRDSCVEFFVRPRPGSGYLNFEINCGGTLLAYYIEDWTKTTNGFAKFTPLTLQDAENISIRHSMPEVTEPEITEPVNWTIELFIPFSLISKYTGAQPPVAGERWRGNFYKCGDETSHPHWAAWSRVPELNFHDPDAFGELIFG